MTSQEKARIRNWQKARLVSFCIDVIVLSENELELLNHITLLKRQLLENWDKTSYELAGKPMPTYKCRFCGKRLNKEYSLLSEGEALYFCKKHYNEMAEFQEYANYLQIINQ